MSVVSNISALAQAIAAKIKTMMPRLVPAGGSTGMWLGKATSADFDVAWRGPAQQATLTIASGVTTGRLTWTFPYPYATGVVPVIMAIPVKPTNSTLTYVVSLYGDPTNTAATIEVNTINPSQSIVAGGTVTITTPAPSGTKIFFKAAQP